MSKTSNEKLSFRAHSKKGLLVKKDGDWQSVAPFIEVVGLAKEEGSDDFLLVINFEVDGKRTTLLHPNRDTLNPGAIIAELVGKGYAAPKIKENLALLGAYISQTPPARRQTILRRTGWYDGRYVRPDGGIIPGGKHSSIIYEPDDRRNLASASAGTLKEWKKLVATPALNSSTMMFAITAAFASLILDYTSVESGMFHLYGRSTAGKSLTLCVGLSVGQRGTKVGMPHWDFTKAGFEELAAAYSGRLLVIDEAGHIQDAAAIEKLRQTAFMMTAEGGRIRSRHFKGSINTLSWRLIALSSGERPVSDLALSGGRRRIGGEEVRLIDVPATREGGHGVFDSVPDGLTSAELAGAIEKAANRHYGHAAEAFLARLTKRSRGPRRKEIGSLRSHFRQKANVAEDGFERRFSSRFELCYAAGALAIRWKILPWKPERLLQAILDTYRSARSSVPEYEAMMDGALSKVVRHLQTSSRGVSVKDLRAIKDAEKRRRAAERAAFYILSSSEKEVIYGVKKDTLAQWIGIHVSPQVFGQYLAGRDILVVTKRGLPMKQVSIPGLVPSRPYLYCFKASQLNSDAGGQDRDRTAE